MTISRSDNKVTFTCNGSTHVFTFEFPIIDSGDLVVTLINTATGEETVLTSGTNYVVAASDSGYGGGGTVTTQAAGETGMEHYSYPAGYTILIQRSTPKTQLMDLRTGQVVDLQDIEDAFDKMQAQILDMQETIDRCIKFPARDTSPEAELAAAPLRANKFLAFDTDGDAQASSGPIVGITPTTFAESLLDDNDAAEAWATLMPSVITLDAATITAAQTSLHLRRKVKVETRETDADAGDVTYTGYGFRPSLLLIKAQEPSGAYGESDGVDDGTTHYCQFVMGGAHADHYHTYIATQSIAIAKSSGSEGQFGLVKNFTSDGFVITWNKNGSPSSHTMTLLITAFE